MPDNDIVTEVAVLIQNGLRMGSAIRAVAHANMMSFGDVQELVNQQIEFSWPAQLALGVSFA